MELTGTFKSIPSETRLALAPVGSSRVQAVCVVAALVGACPTLVMVWKHKRLIVLVATDSLLQMTRPPPPNDLVQLTYTVIFAINILQVVTLLTLAEVAAEGIDTLSVVRAEVLSSYTFINI